MTKRIDAILLVIALFFTGCNLRHSEDAGWPVVSQISVIRNDNGGMTQRIYTNQQKMRQILNQLRSLGQKSTPPIDPETISARTYSVTVTMSDGTQRLYQTKSDRYIRIGHNPWQQADPKRIEDLNQLLQNLPGDS